MSRHHKNATGYCDDQHQASRSTANVAESARKIIMKSTQSTSKPKTPSAPRLRTVSKPKASTKKAAPKTVKAAPKTAKAAPKSREDANKKAVTNDENGKLSNLGDRAQVLYDRAEAKLSDVVQNVEETFTDVKRKLGNAADQLSEDGAKKVRRLRKATSKK